MLHFRNNALIKDSFVMRTSAWIFIISHNMIVWLNASRKINIECNKNDYQYNLNRIHLLSLIWSDRLVQRIKNDYWRL